ncbi:hypothetical protein L7F22_037378 [Adiantum nelumboides]|nr:hypothetical protein [Adiantum nelumboides]
MPVQLSSTSHQQRCWHSCVAPSRASLRDLSLCHRHGSALAMGHPWTNVGTEAASNVDANVELPGTNGRTHEGANNTDADAALIGALTLTQS